jgi:hypothetical protein
MSLHLGEDVTDDLSLRITSHITQLWPCHRMVQVYAMYDRRGISIRENLKPIRGVTDSI